MTKSPSEDSLARSDSPRDTLEAILNAHFTEKTLENIKSLVDGWGEHGEEDKQNAVNLMHAAVNFDRGKAIEFFNQVFDESKRSADSSEGISYRILDAVSQHCSGVIDRENDPIWRQCRDVSDLSDEYLQDKIGRYFRDKTDQYLSTTYPVEYQLALIDIGRSDSNSSNKTSPSSSPKSPSTEPERLQRSDSERSAS
jgi:hypothetical protein